MDMMSLHWLEFYFCKLGSFFIIYDGSERIVLRRSSAADDEYVLSQNIGFCWPASGLQCLDTVGWASGRASGQVLVWLSIWSDMQIVCIWSS